MTASAGGGVLAEVQRQLAAGGRDEEIVAALTARGLSLASAERFLERARPTPPAPPSHSPPPVPPPVPASGSTHVSTSSVPPAPSLVAGAAPARHEPSQPAIAEGPPEGMGSRVAVIGGSLALTGALVAVGLILTARAPKTSDATSATVGARTASSSGTLEATRAEMVARHVQHLQGPSTSDACLAADALAELGAREQIPRLARLLDAPIADEHKICAARALVRLGEGAAMLPQYVAWSQDENDVLALGGISGFGQIGPSAAHEAVPLLRDALLDGPTPARRLVIVSTLARLGPAAAPALQLVVDDEDAQVRTAAQKALDALR